MKHLIITGASGNLGRELIKKIDFSRYDKIYLIGKDDLNQNQNLISDGISIFSNYNLADENSVKELFDQIKTQKGDLLFIIHLAGGYIGGKYFWEFSKDEFQQMIEENLYSAFLISKYGFIKAKEISGGSIIFISARLSLEYAPKRSVYAVSKNALNFLVSVIEKEAAEFNFTANALAPLIILTEESKKWIKESDYNKCTSPEEIAKIIDSIFSNHLKFNGNIIKTNDKI